MLRRVVFPAQKPVFYTFRTEITRICRSERTLGYSPRKRLLSDGYSSLFPVIPGLFLTVLEGLDVQERSSRTYCQKVRNWRKRGETRVETSTNSETEILTRKEETRLKPALIPPQRVGRHKTNSETGIKDGRGDPHPRI